MKVLAFNGSPRKNGNTSMLIHKVFDELNEAGIETEEINVGADPIRGCMGCGRCREIKNGKCVFDDDALNGWVEQMVKADGIILGSPVYIAGVSGQMKSFMDRSVLAAMTGGDLLKRKPGASVTAARRAGCVATFHSLNAWFTVAQMIVVGSSYWNMGFGGAPGEVEQDKEGLQTMRNLGLNMAWLLKIIEASKDTIEPPVTKKEIITNFIR